MCSEERSDVYLVNESSKLESVSRVYEIEKSHSLLDHPRMDDVRGDFLGPPHGTTPTAVITNKI